ncbi:hypothetical protein FZ928_07970 [Klebsiella pneumoniae]|uniref:Uncharacterized protein n=1 Tax=Klebsiella pneumoniae TaxID=573 RepID=A0A5C2LMA8_KLEPN|nr:hypothetical protein FZ928_07970 [Klebsiella pneumoniae]
MNGTVRQSPAMDIQRRSCFNARWRLRLYRAYTLPARSCRPGKRSAARQWAQEMNGSVRQSPTIGIPRLSRFNARWRLRLTGPTFSLRADVGRASAAPPGNRHKR